MVRKWNHLWFDLVVILCLTNKNILIRQHQSILEEFDIHGLDSSGWGEGQVAGACECSNELLGSIKCGGISWIAKGLLVSQQGLCSMELFSWLVCRLVSSVLSVCSLGMQCIFYLCEVYLMMLSDCIELRCHAVWQRVTNFPHLLTPWRCGRLLPVC